mmetsp:Transcript_3427/g.11917  ORF Transcript_3427/g.11917 Transcript_3427/m.11917 type:complete len:511 (-) Transcript_3427:173-1705(-)
MARPGVVAAAAAFALALSSALPASALEVTQPQQVHLALGETRDMLRVMWSTQQETEHSVVEWGPASGLTLSSRATGYHWNFTDGGPLKLTQTFHVADIKGLSPGQRYRYHVGDPSGGWSEVFEVVAPRSDEQISKDALRIISYCDAGDIHSLTLADVQEDVATNVYDMLIHCGDFAYDLFTDNGRRGDDWMNSIQPVAATLPYMVSAGNHEWYYNFSHYRNRFLMPGPDAKASENHWYSFDIGPAHVVAYNTEAFFQPQDYNVSYMQAMYDWLEQDLKRANANRAAVPWVIVHAHRPMYCVVRGPDGDCDGEHRQSRKGIPSQCSEEDNHVCEPLEQEGGEEVSFPVEDLFYRYGVDLAIYGHVHDYERFWPVYNLTVVNGTDVTLGRYFDPHATVHMTTGSGGNPEMILGTDPPPRGLCGYCSPWCAFQSGYYPQGKQASDYTYSRIEVHNATHLTWEQWSSIDQAVIDRFVIEAPHHGPFEHRRQAAAAAAQGGLPRKAGGAGRVQIS